MSKKNSETDVDFQDHLLFAGILQEARDKAEKIVADARKAADARLLRAQQDADKHVHDEQALMDTRVRTVQLQIESVRKAAQRKASLLKQDRYHAVVMQRVRELLEAKIHDKNFSRTIVAWIAEAAIGLGVSEALVSFSPDTPVTEEMLRDAEKLVKNVSGATIKLQTDEKKLTSAGVCVSSPDGTMSFSNHIADRLRRFDRDIKNLVEKRTCRIE